MSKKPIIVLLYHRHKLKYFTLWFSCYVSRISIQGLHSDPLWGPRIGASHSLLDISDNNLKPSWILSQICKNISPVIEATVWIEWMPSHCVLVCSKSTCHRPVSLWSEPECPCSPPCSSFTWNHITYSHSEYTQNVYNWTSAQKLISQYQQRKRTNSYYDTAAVFLSIALKRK